MESLRRLARGRSEATPARALGGVALVVYAVFAVVAAAAILLYVLT